MNRDALIDLLPCPFCGGEAKPHEEDKSWERFAGLVSCSGDDEECPMQATYVSTERWNTRYKPALANSADALVALVNAAQMLHDDTMDYIRINKLGGENNHSLKAVREALAALPDEWRGE